MELIGITLGQQQAEPRGPYARLKALVNKRFKPSLERSAATPEQLRRSDIALKAQQSRPRETPYGAVLPSWSMGEKFNIPDHLQALRRVFPDITPCAVAVIDTLAAIELANASGNNPKHRTTGRCTPTVGGIARHIAKRTGEALTYTPRMVQYALRQLSGLGLEIVNRFNARGRQRSSRYRPLHWLKWVRAVAQGKARLEDGYTPAPLPENGGLDLADANLEGALPLDTGGEIPSPPRAPSQITTIPPTAQIPHVTDKTDAETAAPSLKNLSGAALARAELAAALSRRRE